MTGQLLWALVIYGVNTSTILSVAPVSDGRTCGEYRHALIQSMPVKDQWRVECRAMAMNPLKLN